MKPKNIGLVTLLFIFLTLIITFLVIVLTNNKITITLGNNYQVSEDQSAIFNSSFLDIFIDKSNSKTEVSDKITIPILLYHHIADRTEPNSYYVPPEIFREQMMWLKDNNYHVISYSTAVNCIKGYEQLPSRPIVITFDDGVNDQYANAFPILKEFNYPAMFFIKINNFNSPSGISTLELKEMISSGMEVGSHTVNHDNLTSLDDDALSYELMHSKKVLEEELEIFIKHFSYPGGSYNDKVVEATKKAGYDSAVTVIHSIVQDTNDLYRLHRSHIDNDLDNLVQRVQGLMPELDNK